jgi:hypothetical protein
MAIQPAGAGGAVERQGSGTLSDVITIILDKGLVIDVFARISLVGIELLRIDARVVVASVDTYLRFAERVNRLEVGAQEPTGLPGLVGEITESGAKGKTRGALEAAAEKLEEIIGSEGERQEVRRGRRR